VCRKIYFASPDRRRPLPYQPVTDVGVLACLSASLLTMPVASCAHPCRMASVADLGVGAPVIDGSTANSMPTSTSTPTFRRHTVAVASSHQEKPKEQAAGVTATGPSELNAAVAPGRGTSTGTGGSTLAMNRNCTEIIERIVIVFEEGKTEAERMLRRAEHLPAPAALTLF
jgi:hypothetical protein